MVYLRWRFAVPFSWLMQHFLQKWHFVVEVDSATLMIMIARCLHNCNNDIQCNAKESQRNSIDQESSYNKLFA